MDDERIGRCVDAEICRINDRQLQRVRLPTQIRSPAVHPLVGKLGLPARACEPCMAGVSCAIEQNDAHQRRGDPFHGAAD